MKSRPRCSSTGRLPTYPSTVVPEEGTRRSYVEAGFRVPFVIVRIARRYNPVVLLGLSMDTIRYMLRRMEHKIADLV